MVMRLDSCEDTSVGSSAVAKKKQDAVSTRQVNFRASPELLSRLETAALGLGLDVSNFVRMVLLENLTAYEKRAELARKKSGSN